MSTVLRRRNWKECERRAIISFYGDKCLACGEPERLVLDHVIPISVGGLDDFSNIQVLCGPCNRHKYTKTTDYRDGKVFEGVPQILSLESPAPVRRQRMHRLVIEMDTTLRTAIEVESARADRTMSGFIRNILQNHIEE